MFLKSGYIISNKISKNMEIFYSIEEFRNWRACFSTKILGQLIFQDLSDFDLAQVKGVTWAKSKSLKSWKQWADETGGA